MTAATPVRRLLVETLKLAHGAHRQRAEQALANIGTSSLPKLKRALRDEAKAELRQAHRVERAFAALGERPGSAPDRAMEGLVGANNALVARSDARAERDLANIAAAQAAAHLLIVNYGAARAYAAAIGQRGVARLAAKTLAELKSRDSAMTGLAADVLRRSRQPGYPATSHAPVKASALLGTVAVGIAGLALLNPPRPRRRGLAAYLPRR